MARTFEQIADEINKAGWLVLNCCQFSVGKWRANAQRRSDSGSTLTVFSEFADGRTASEAMEAVLFNVKQQRNLKAGTYKDTFPEKKHATLVAALDTWEGALYRDAVTRADNRDDDL